MKDLNIVAVIPARGGSKGIPKKNIIDFCGKPLIGWSIEAALGCPYIKNVYVTSDDTGILDVAVSSGAEAIKRPARLATDTATTEDAVLHALSGIKKRAPRKIDAVVLLQATSPLRTPEDIGGAVELFMAEKADSLFSGTVLDDFCVWSEKSGRMESVTYDYKNRGRRQDRKPLYLENGSFYIFTPETIEKNKNRLGGKIVFFGMPFWKSYEIDKREDVEICEYYMRRKIL